MNSLTALFALATLGAPVAATKVWVVTPPTLSSNSLYSTLNLAANGDILVLKSGIYSTPGNGYEILGKGLVLVADVGADVRIYALSIRQLGAGQTVTLRNLSFGWPGGPPGDLSLLNNSGRVVIDHCAIGASDTGPMHNGTAALAITNSSAVLLDRCRIQASTGALFPVDVWHGLASKSSSVHVYDCQVAGGRGAPQGSGGDAVRVDGGFFFASGCSFSGGDPGAHDAGCAGAGLRVLGGADVRTLDTAIAAGAASAACTPPAPPIDVVAGTYATYAGSARSMSVSSPVREGENTLLELDAQGGDLALLGLAYAPGAVHDPLLHGTVQLKLPQWSTLFLGTVPASGHKTISVPIRPLEPSMQGIAVYLQALYVTPPDTLTLGSASVLVVLDAAF